MMFVVESRTSTAIYDCTRSCKELEIIHQVQSEQIDQNIILDVYKR